MVGIVTACSTPTERPSVSNEKKTRQKRAAKPSMLWEDIKQADGHTLTPAYLLEAYEQNEIAADQLYKGRRILVRGRVDKVGRDILGKPYLTLSGRTELRSVQAFFPETALAQLAQLRRGEVVYVVGTCEGLMLNILLQDCLFLGNHSDPRDFE